jgi:predicted MFS family arabinose efflux permease
VSRPAATLVRDRTTWLIYAQLGVWAYFLYGFGPVVPLLRDEQQVSRTVAGLHGTAFAVGGVVGGALLPWLVRRLGRHVLIWSGIAGICLSVLGFWVSHGLPYTLGFAVLAALSGTCAVNGMVAALSDHHGPAGPASISEANAVAAAVGLVAPLVVGASVAAGLGWRPGLAAVLGLVALIALVAVLLRVRVPVARVPVARAPLSTVDSPLRTPLPRRFWLVWTSLIATGSVEASLNLWVADVLRTHAHVPAGVATAATSAMIGGLVVGRLVGGRLVLRLPATSVLLGSLGLAAAGFGVFWLAAVPWLGLAGLVVCGLGISMHYPLGMALAVEHSAGQPDLATARTSYALGLAFGVAPFLLGAVADRTGPHTAFLLLPAFLAVSAAAVAALVRSAPVDSALAGSAPVDSALAGSALAGSALAGSALAGEREAVADGQQHAVHPVVGEHDLVELHDRAGVGRRAGIEHPAAAEHVVGDDHAAGPHPGDQFGPVPHISGLVCVDEG